MDGHAFAALSKSQVEIVAAGLRDGRKWTGLVSEVRERTNGRGLEPVVAVLLLQELGAILDEAAKFYR